MDTFLLIPGAGGTAWYWHRLVPELERDGHVVITVDLPAGDDHAGLQEYVDAVVAAGATKASDRLVVVAQSMGGLTAPLVCSRLPVKRLVLVNAMIPAPGESGNDWWVNTGQDAARRALDLAEGRSPDAPFDPLVYFFHDVPEDITRVAMAGDAPQSATPFEQPWPLDAWPDVPTVVLSSREDRFFPVDFQRRVRRNDWASRRRPCPVATWSPSVAPTNWPRRSGSNPPAHPASPRRGCGCRPFGGVQFSWRLPPGRRGRGG